MPNGGIVSLSFGDVDMEAPIRKLLPFFFDEDHVDRPIREDGGQLVASLSVQGYVFFISHPRKSEWIKPTDESLIIGGPIEPTKVSAKLIQKMVRRHLIVLRKSSFYGGNGSLSWWERWVYRGIIFRELRNRYTLYRSLISLTNEWGKAIVAAVIATVLSLLAAAITSPSCCQPCDSKTSAVATAPAK